MHSPSTTTNEKNKRKPNADIKQHNGVESACQGREGWGGRGERGGVEKAWSGIGVGKGWGKGDGRGERGRREGDETRLVDN